MIEHGTNPSSQLVETEWIAFPGGELEGRRPKALCPACRAALWRAPEPPKRAPLCFQCYRAALDRQRALKAAGQIDTASPARFQSALPFEPVDKPRLAMLRAERSIARAAAQSGPDRFVDKRRHAQIAARHALQQIAAGLQARAASKPDRDRAMVAAFHAAELQLPEAWLPFVVSR